MMSDSLANPYPQLLLITSLLPNSLAICTGDHQVTLGCFLAAYHFFICSVFSWQPSTPGRNPSVYVSSRNDVLFWDGKLKMYGDYRNMEARRLMKPVSRLKLSLNRFDIIISQFADVQKIYPYSS